MFNVKHQKEDMAKKKNNNIWYILGGLVIIILIIVIIIIQIQNKQKQDEIQSQLDAQKYAIDKKNCEEKCADTWIKEEGTCKEKFEILRNRGIFPGRNPEDFNCNDSYPNEKSGLCLILISLTTTLK